LKSDIKNPDSLNLIVSDIKGYFYIYNINKNILINQFKIHESPIIDFKISSKNKSYKNSIIYGDNQTPKILVFSLEKNSTLKIFDLNNGELNKSVKIFKEPKDKVIFDIDSEEKYIVYSKNTKIKLLSLENLYKNNNVKSSTTKIGMHSQEISNLKFSSDGKFILSSTLRDFIIYVWHLKNKDTPLFSFQNDFFPIDNYLLKIDKGIYHGVSISRENISIFKVDLKDIDPNEPLKSLFNAKFPQTNLIGVYVDDIIKKEKKDFIDFNELEYKNSEKIISAFYGNYIKIERKNFNYCEKANKDNIKKEDIEIILDEKQNNKNSTSKNSNVKSVVVNSNKFKILNEIEMSKNEIINKYENEESKEFKQTNNQSLILVNPDETNELTISDTKISLLNIIRNSLINNDINQFEWALDQKVGNFFFFLNLILFYFINFMFYIIIYKTDQIIFIKYF